MNSMVAQADQYTVVQSKTKLANFKIGLKHD